MKITTFIAVFLLLSGAVFAQAPEMVQIDGGTFLMGNNYSDNPDERPQRKVTVKTFYMAKYEVTIEQYTLFCKARSTSIPTGEPKQPVTNITWNDAVMYCNWLSDMELLDHCYLISRDSSKFYAKFTPAANGYRLPTEAEWEYASRGGSKTKHYAYSGSNEVDDVSWNITNSNNSPHTVGTKKPNELGIYDMTGNALEWCSDWYLATYYGQKENNDPIGPESGAARVCRGGNYLYRKDVLRNTSRYSLVPTNIDGLAGIRLTKNQ